MANTIRIKRKSTTGAPANGDLVEGELAINTADQKLYSKDATTVFEIGTYGETLPSGTTTDQTLRWTGSAWTQTSSLLVGSGGLITGGRFIGASNSVATVIDYQCQANGNFGAEEGMNFITDTDNSGTSRNFQWGTNANGTTGMDLLMTLTDAGNLIVDGSVTVYGDASSEGVMSHSGGTTPNRVFTFDMSNTDYVDFTNIVSPGGVRIRDGAALEIYNSTDASYLSVTHDGTDVNWTGVNTTDFIVDGLTWFKMLAGGGLAVYDSTNADEINISHDGTYANINTVNTDALRIQESVWVYGSGPSEFRIYDGSGIDYATFSHDGIDFNTVFTNTTDWNITSLTSIQAGTVNADFDVVTATSFTGTNVTSGVDPGHTHTIYATRSSPQFFGGDWEYASTTPRMTFYETDQIADEGKWDFQWANGNWNFRSRTDADGAGSTFMQIVRGTGTAVASIELNRQVNVNDSLDVTGTITASGSTSANWNTAFGWGDHSTQNYALTTGDTFTGPVIMEAAQSADLLELGDTTAGENIRVRNSGGIIKIIPHDGTAYNFSNEVYYDHTVDRWIIEGDVNLSGDTYDSTKYANWQTAFGWGDHDGLYLPIGGGTLTGGLTVDDNSAAADLTLGDGAGTDGDILLKFNMDRAWQFQQSSTGATTSLVLKQMVASKVFNIRDNLDVDRFAFNPTNGLLTLTGTMAATTVTGANVTSGSDPGHTHTAYLTAEADTLDSVANRGATTDIMLQLRPDGTTQVMHPAMLLRGASNGTANYILSMLGTIYVGVFNGGAPTDPSEMIGMSGSSVQSPSLKVGDSGSTGNPFIQIKGVTLDSTDLGNYDTAFGWGDHGVENYLKNIVEDVTPQLGGNLDMNSKYITSTYHGRVGNSSLEAQFTLASEWANLPVGYGRMARNTTGTAGGAPVNNYGYFTKSANRDGAGGWGGIWCGYTAGENYMGRAADSSTFANWDKLWSDTNLGTKAQFNTACTDGTFLFSGDVTSDTGVPAMLSSGGLPVLNTGITAAEYRTAIGAGTSSTTGTVTGTGVNNQVSLWSGTSSQDGSANLTFSASNELSLGTSGTILLQDNNRVGWGNSVDGQISYSSGSDELQLACIGTTDVAIYTAATDLSLLVTANAGVGLYYNNVLKFLTTTTGATLTGNMTVTSRLVATDAEFTGLGPLTTPGADDLYVGGYGIMGDRSAGTIYVTNANANTSSNVSINAGGVHGAAATRAKFWPESVTGRTSAGQIKDHGGTLRDIGFNVLPTFNFNATDTLEARHCGHATGKTNTSLYTLTGPTSSDVDFPVGGVAHVYNLGTSGNYLISDTGTCTMYVCDGSAAPQDIVGTCTLAPGGMATLWRYSTTAIYITGTGITV